MSVLHVYNLRNKICLVFNLQEKKSYLLGRPSWGRSNYARSGHERSLWEGVGHIVGHVLRLCVGLEGLHTNSGGNALHILLLKVCLSVLLSLGESDIKWLKYFK